MEFDGKIENSETTLPVSEAERKGEKGVTTVEYAVMLVLIAIAIMVANPNISSSASTSSLPWLPATDQLGPGLWIR